MSTAIEKNVTHLVAKISKEVINNGTPSGCVCLDLIEELKKLKITIAVLETTKIGKLVTKSIKNIKRHKRTETDQEEVNKLELSIKLLTELLEGWKKLAEKEAKSVAAKKKKKKTTMATMNEKETTGLPNTSSEYRNRLIIQKKELYKDPPVLPPSNIVIESSKCAIPKRNQSGGLTFVSGEDSTIQSLLNDFHPNRSPEEVLRQGAFGGTYFRPIASAVTNVRYNSQKVLKDTVEDEWIEGLTMNKLTSSTYQKHINKFGVKCGGSLGMWESSGWIVESDPYGWFQWYCRFYQGRRCSDDARQISRWCKSAGPKGRFRSQLCNKILAAQTTFDDSKISPVIRQTLLHWGLEITSSVLQKHRKRVGK